MRLMAKSQIDLHLHLVQHEDTQQFLLLSLWLLQITMIRKLHFSMLLINLHFLMCSMSQLLESQIYHHFSIPMVTFTCSYDHSTGAVSYHRRPGSQQKSRFLIPHPFILSFEKSCFHESDHSSKSYFTVTN